jgi:D-sedoheptulose 7-phosphate isomerase
MTQELFSIFEPEDRTGEQRYLDHVERAGEEADPIEAAVRAHLIGSADLKRTMAEEGVTAILSAAQLMVKSLQAGHKVLLCGNGGSAADCEHMAAKFVNRLSKDFARPGLPAIALTTDTSFLTAFSNDCGFEGIFERQVQTLALPGDVLIGISSSGASPNVVRAMKAASKMGIETIALTGNGGPLGDIATITISVPHTNTLYIQEAHLAIEHILCSLIEHELFGRKWRGETLSTL